MQRRKFLHRTALSVAALSLNTLDSLAQSRWEYSVKVETPKKIVVIGAGLAGLCAAYELTQKGHAVTVLEAKSVVGGRVSTLRNYFADDQYAELGATFIPDVHDLTIKYAKFFGLQLVPAPANLPAVYYFRGQRFKDSDRLDFLGETLHLRPEEKKLRVKNLWPTYAAPFVNKLGNPAVKWEVEKFKEYDNISLEDLFRQQGLSDNAVSLLSLGYEENNGGALQALRNDALHKNQRTEYCISGGNDQLPKAFAAKLAGKVYYQAPVVKLEQNASSVNITYLNANQAQTITADRVICAIPFSVLRRIYVEPQFSPEKQKVINNLKYLSVSRVFLQAKKRFWLDQGFSGAAATDLPVMKLRHTSLIQKGEKGILNSYTEGKAARQLMAMSEQERIGFTVAQIEKIYPGMQQNFERGISKCWDEDEYSRGAYGIFGLGEMAAMTPHLATAEGRIHFAGEHTSVWSGWMQGALASGIRVAGEISSAEN